MTYQVQGATWSADNRAQFAQMVESHIAALREYDAHMARVQADADLPDDDPDKHTVFAAPAAHSEVMASIRVIENGDGTHSYEPDYEIVGPALAQKKAVLFQRVSEAERDAINAAIPPGKQRLWQFRENDIYSADEARLRGFDVKSLSEEMIKDLPAWHRGQRSDADNAFLDEQAERRKRQEAIQRWAAQQHADIEDLTDDTVDGWEMKPLNG